MIWNSIINFATSSDSSSSSTTVSSDVLQPLGEFIWSVANAVLILLIVVAGIFLLFLFIWYCVLLAQNKSPEERKETFHRFFWLIVCSVGIVIVGTLSNVLFPLLEHHAIFANPYSN